MRVAVIEGEGARAPSEAVLAAFEVGLSREDTLDLVERRRVARVLTELKLGARGLTEPGTVARLGHLLSADLMVFVERLPGVRPEAVRMRVVETRTGIALGSDVGRESSLARNVSPAMRAIRLSATKLLAPAGKRRYVGVLGFRSEELGRSLEGRAEAMGMLLASDLDSSPNVVLLERGHLERLSREELLSGAEVSLRSSAILLDGTLRRALGGKAFDVKVTLRPLVASGPAKTLSISIPTNGLVTGREKLAAAVLKALQVGTVECVFGDPKREAAIFLERCDVLRSHREFEAAVMAGEAAFALDPSQDTRRVLAQARNSLAFELRREVLLANPRGDRLLNAPSDLKLRMLSCLLRERSLRHDLYLRHELRLAEGKEVSARLPRILGKGGPFRVATRPRESSVRRLAEEIGRLDDRIAHFLLQYHARGWPNLYAQNEWWHALAWNVAAGIHERSSDAREWARRFKDVVSLWENPPGPCHPQNRYALPGMLGTCFEFGVRRRFTTPEDKTVVVETLDWMARRETPLVRMTAHLAKLGFNGRGDTASAGAALDIVRDELPLGHPDRLPAARPKSLATMLIPAIEAIRDQKEKARRCGEILEPLVGGTDATALLGWERMVGLWSRAFVKQGKHAEARRVFERTIAALSRGDRGSRGVKVDRMKGRLEKELARLPRPRGEGGHLADAWAAYTVSRIDIGGPPAKGAKLVDGLVVGRRLVLVWAEMVPLRKGGKRSQTARLYATATSVSGGARALLGKVSVKKSPGVHKYQVRSVATDGSAVYVATNRGGLAVFRDGRATVWTEKKGLPAGGVYSVACHDGKVYLGVGGYLEAAGLIEFDPRRRRFKIVASSRSTTAGGALSGGKPYQLRGLVADATRKCVWFSVNAGRDSKRAGLWRLFPGTGRIERFWKTRNSFGIKNMLLDGRRILASTSSVQWSGEIGTLVLINPDNGKKTWLAGGWSPSVECGREPAFKRALGDMWPVAIVGDHIITGDALLRLHTKDGDSSVLESAPDGRRISDVMVISEYADSILVGCESGDVYRIRRRPRTGKRVR